MMRYQKLDMYKYNYLSNENSQEYFVEIAKKIQPHSKKNIGPCHSKNKILLLLLNHHLYTETEIIITLRKKYPLNPP